MDYYHDLITEKSWKMLQKLKRNYSFAVIGGWAVYLYTQGLKSRDIDFICDYEALEKLKSRYELIKNDRLKKYEIRMGEFDVDIYVPFFSDLGIPVEDLIQMTQFQEGFSVLKPEPLLILKQKAFKDRAQSIKGEKDKIDIISLLQTGLKFKEYKMLLKKYGLEHYKKDLHELLSTTRAVQELDLSQHAFAKLKKDILKQLS